MKKSKFLKKSLAMLLALMLVVAMIPLSASAAQTQPALNYLYVNDLTVANENGTFEVDAHYESTGVKLSIAPNALNYGGKVGKLYVLETNTSEKKEVTANDYTFAFSTYATSASNSTGHTTWTLTMQLVDENGKQVGENLKVVVNGVAVSTTASLDVNSATEGTGSYDVDINNGSHEIILTVPKNSASTTYPAHFRVATQDNATIDDGPGADATPVTGAATTNQYDHYYDVAVSSNKDAYILVTSESGKNQARWDITVKEVGVLTSFALGDYKGTINENAAGGPTVEVVLPKSLGTNEYGKPVDITLPVIFEQYGNEGTIDIDGTDYTSGQSFNTTKGGQKLINITSTNPKYKQTYTIKMDAAGYNEIQTYTLTVRLAESENTAIKRAFFNGVEATIDGDKITAVLPTKTNLEEVKIDLYTDINDDIGDISVSDARFVSGTANDGNAIDGMKHWVSSTDANWNDGRPEGIDISKGKQVVVEAENGDTQTYVLSATVETNSTAAEMTKIYIKGDGQQVEGSITGNTITFTVPYMTLNVGDWTVFATTNGAANAMYKTTGTVNNVGVRNGGTTLGDLNAAFNDNIPSDSKNISVENAISAVNMNDDDYRTDYKVVVKLDDALTGKVSVSKFEMSVQNVNPTDAGQTCAKIYDRVTKENSIAATSSNGITTTSKEKDNTGVITMTVRHGLSTESINKNSLYRILTDIDTTNGGVAFYATMGSSQTKFNNAVRLSDLASSSATYSPVINFTGSTAYNEDGKTYVIVLPEDIARDVLKDGNNQISVSEASSGVIYRLVENAQKPSNERAMSNISVDGVSLKVTDTHDVSVAEISGALPWSYTITPAELASINASYDVAKAHFLTYDISAFATLTTDGELVAGGGNYLYSNGDSDFDGTANNADKSNQKLLFVQGSGNNVDVYTFNGTKWDQAVYKTYKNTLSVVAEDEKSELCYTFKLTYNQPNTEAEMKSFSIGNSKGVIDGKNITVVVPYGSDLMGLIPTFTTSDNATVTLDSFAQEKVISGKTALNFNQVVRLKVTSEDTKKVTPYTVTVKVSEAFSDVPSSAWYYNNVMQAAAAGIVIGRGDGTFAPLANVTRRDFAIMLTQMLGVSNDGTAVSPFIDVDDDDYGVVSIAYCKAHNIISGYDDGTFKPDATITRQEAASMIVKAMGVSKASDELYPDDSTIAGWAKDAVYKAKAAGLMKGYEEDGTFRPTGKITRAEAASIMVNALNQ